MSAFLPAASQMGLVVLLVCASATPFSDIATPKSTDYATTPWSEKERTLLRLTRWIMHTALVRHIAIMAWMILQYWHSNGQAPATMGLLLMSVVLLAMGGTVCFANMTYFEHYFLGHHTQILAGLHPLALLGILLPHTLPGCNARAVVALMVAHNVEWQLYPNTIADNKLLTLLQMEAASAVYVLIVRSGLTLSVGQVAYYIMLALAAGVLIPYLALRISHSLTSHPSVLQPMSVPSVFVVTILATAVQFGYHVEAHPVLWLDPRGQSPANADIAQDRSDAAQAMLLHATLLLQMLAVLLSLVSTSVSQLMESTSHSALEKNDEVVNRGNSGYLDRLLKENPPSQWFIDTVHSLGHQQCSALSVILVMALLQAGALWHMLVQVLMGADVQAVGLVISDVVLLTAGALVQVVCGMLLAAGKAQAPPVTTELTLPTPTPLVFPNDVPSAFGSTAVANDKLEQLQSRSSPQPNPQGPPFPRSVDSPRTSSQTPFPPQASPQDWHATTPRMPTQADLMEKYNDALSSLRWFLEPTDTSCSPTESIKGICSAITALFPTVRHTAIYWLQRDRVHTNNFVLLGQGASQSPRCQVPVLNGSLVYYVLLKQQVAYINNCSTPAAAFSDVQYLHFVLQVKRLACLPIVTDGKSLGCILLGFPEPSTWEIQDKALASQLAAALSANGDYVQILLEPRLWPLPTSRPASARRGSSRASSYGVNGSGDLPKIGSRTVSTGGHSRDLTRDGVVDLPGPARRSASSSGANHSPALVSNSSDRMGPRRRKDSNIYSSHASHTLPLASSNTGSVLSTRDSAIGRDTTASLYNTNDSHSYEFDNRELETYSHMVAAETTALSDSDDSNFDAPQDQSDNTAFNDVNVLELIGAGGFGNVYRALWNRQLVAVKVMEHGDESLGLQDNRGGDDAEDCRNALLEGAMTSAISHPNVVTTYDYLVKNVVKPGGSTRRILQETQIIMEYCDKGSLGDVVEEGFFHRDPDHGSEQVQVQVDMEGLLVTLLEVAHAVEYLHSLQITHRDLKPKNILLKSSNKDHRGFTAKVSDFGLSQVLNDKSKPHITSKYCGTITHMPPELIEDGRVYSAGDVYAFGIIMWECYTQLTPYKGLVHPQIMMGVVSSCLRPAFPSTCPPGYRTLAERCWHQDPKSRPTFTAVANGIRALLNAL